MQQTVDYQEHIGESRPYWRDMILGVNDGLVSVLLLVAGVVGGGLTANQVLLTGVAGAVAGALSMAAGEYLATKSQDDVLAAEIALEEDHIKHHRKMETDQLRGMLKDMGVSDEDLGPVFDGLTRNDRVLLNAMKVLEFGVVESERRLPRVAMLVSGSLFLLGSACSVVPFFFSSDTSVGLAWAAALTALGLFVVGIIKAAVAKTGRIRSGLENLIIAGLGGVAAWWIGRFVDAGLS
jgi:VIT1/CCC1 family predicted Fe2+/Mn2+ transporter